MKKRNIFVFLLTVALTSCGKDVALALEQEKYNTQLFYLNNYQDTILNDALADSFILQTETINVASEHLFVGVTSLKNVDRYYDNGRDGQTQVTDSIYAENNKLSLTLPEVKYGLESKLFDGILHCFDASRKTKSRLQLQESGFGYLFNKQANQLNHVGLYLKAGHDYTLGGVAISDIKATLSFYVPNGNKFIKYAFVFDINNMPNTDFPILYGFYFMDVLENKQALKNANAISFTYEILNENAKNSDKQHTAVFLYELLLPKSSWN